MDLSFFASYLCDKDTFICKLISIPKTDSSTALIQLIDSALWKDFTRYMVEVNAYYKKNSDKHMIAHCDLKIGLEVIIQIENQCGKNNFIRARIISPVSEFLEILCLDLDEYKKYTIPSNKAFHMNELAQPSSSKTFPRLVFPITLENLDYFKDLPYAGLAHKEMYSSKNKIAYGKLLAGNIFLGTCLQTKDEQDRALYRLQSFHGDNLSEQILSLVSIESHQLKLPKSTSKEEMLEQVPLMNQIEITSTDKDGYIWFQNKDFKLFQRIQLKLNSTLEPLTGKKDSAEYLKYTKNLLNLIQSQDKSIVYATRYKEDGLFYRVVVTELVDGNHANLEFIDYGNNEMGKLRDLYDISSMGPAMQLIPPLCVKAKMEKIAWLDTFYMEGLLEKYDNQIRICLLQTSEDSEESNEEPVPVAIPFVEIDKGIYQTMQDLLFDHEGAAQTTETIEEIKRVVKHFTKPG